MSTERIQNLIARACFGKGDAAPDFTGIPPEDAEALSPKRLALYRRLIRHNVTGVIETMLENTKRRLDAASPGAMTRAIDAFLDEVGPRTSHLRDVPSEFLAFAAPRWHGDASVPRWIADYASLELLDFTIGVAPRPPALPPLAEVTADRPLVFAEPRALVRLAWGVNALADDTEPDERPVAILVYRDLEHCTRFLELTSVSADILQHLFDGEPLGEALRKACDVIDAEAVAGAARLLSDLGERGVLLGARDA